MLARGPGNSRWLGRQLQDVVGRNWLVIITIHIFSTQSHGLRGTSWQEGCPEAMRLKNHPSQRPLLNDHLVRPVPHPTAWDRASGSRHPW